MNVLGDMVRNTGRGYWLVLCIVFGAGFLLYVFVPIKEFKSPYSSGGGTATYTFRKALQLGKIIFIS